MSKIIQLYSKNSSASRANGDVGLLMECAPDSPFLTDATHVLTAQQLLGPYYEYLRDAARLSAQLLHNPLAKADLQHLAVMEEPLVEQIAYLLQTQHLDTMLSAGKYETCVFKGSTVWAERLQAVRQHTGSRYEVVMEGAGKKISALEKLRGRLHTTGSLWQTMREAVRSKLPLYSRYLSGLPDRLRHKVQPGGTWFYSTAYTFSRIGEKYAPYLEAPVNFVFEDTATGGRYFRENGIAATNIYSWARREDIPSRRETKATAANILDSILKVELSPTDEMVRSVLFRGPWFANFSRNLLPLIIFSSRTLERFAQQTRPELVMVGNAEWEACLLSALPKIGSRSLLLQHGVVHATLGFCDKPVERLFVRGRFFRDALSKPLQDKAQVVNLPEAPTKNVERRRSGVPTVLFVTAPIHQLSMIPEQDCEDILTAVLEGAALANASVIVRVHPLESIAYYKQLVNSIRNDGTRDVQVSFSQGPGQEEAVAASSVAVLYWSTMFMDCLRYSVPMISFDWHEFPFRSKYERDKVFNFALDLRNLREMVVAGVQGKISAPTLRMEDILAPSTPELVRSAFDKLLVRTPDENHKASLPLSTTKRQ